MMRMESTRLSELQSLFTTLTTAIQSMESAVRAKAALLTSAVEYVQCKISEARNEQAVLVNAATCGIVSLHQDRPGCLLLRLR